MSRALLLILSLCCATAAAEPIRDPTRPPPGVRPVEPGPVHHTPSGGPVLQSVILSPTRRAAMISGRVVERGGHYGDAVLADVAQDHVVLRRDGSTQVLKLYPGLGKQAGKAAKRR